MNSLPAPATSGPSDGEVRDALDRATAAPPLSRSRRQTQFLRYIVDETLAGRAAKISGYAIAVDVFGKPTSFDAAGDTIVRVEAGRLRQRLAEYYREAGVDDPVVIALPKGSYVPEFRSRRDGAPRPTCAASPKDRVSIAVLPFQNYGVVPDDQTFADGLTEETIASLARFKDLFVFSRSTTTKLARDGAGIGQVREALGVDLVLESSVRKSPRVVRVTVQLIDAATDGHLFAERIERPCTPEGVFEIQDQVARLVAGRVADRYGPLGRYVARASRAGRPRRWDTYLWIGRFYDYYARHRPDLHLAVREGLEAAVAQDPESSDAWAALAATYLDEYRFHFNERHDFPVLDRALEAALRGVTCDPENAMAYQFLAVVYYHRRELMDFRLAADRAVDLNPGHADVLADIGHCYALAGDWDHGLALIDRALEISPVHPGWYHYVPAMRRLLDGDPQAAMLELKKGPMPGFYWYHGLMACCRALAGQKTAAADEVRALLDAYPDFDADPSGECQHWSADPVLIDMLLDGWRKAGMRID